jgi:hypothetical protein
MDPTSVGNAVVVVFEWNDLKYVGKKDANGEVSPQLIVPGIPADMHGHNIFDTAADSFLGQLGRRMYTNHTDLFY